MTAEGGNPHCFIIKRELVVYARREKVGFNSGFFRKPFLQIYVEQTYVVHVRIYEEPS